MSRKLGSSLEAASSDSDYICSFVYSSKKYPDKIYTSMFHFWQDNTDYEAKELNDIFIKMGWLKKIECQLLSDGKRVKVKKHYRSKRYSKLYLNIYREKYGKNNLEQRYNYHNYGLGLG